VTSKLQVTIPKVVADRYQIEPGAELVFEPAGDAIRVVPQRRQPADARERVRLFERALARQRRREQGQVHEQVQDRGWTREELYERGRTR
jgi:bifunctional DNA-binding transcriptional regulator/antitoxin component of YhaV-PrlF toxin-antitoxin module